jgi:hypothetical protein
VRNEGSQIDGIHVPATGAVHTGNRFVAVAAEV